MYREKDEIRGLVFWGAITGLLVLIMLYLLGCSPHRPKAIQLHPQYGNKLMIVPKGNKIGSHTAPSNGVFMTEEMFKIMIFEITLQKKQEFYY